jgi:hypothetical protein
MSHFPAFLIIAYQRNQNVIELIETLSRSGVSRIYVAIDGPKDFKTLSPKTKLVSQLETFQDRKSLQLNVWQRELNLGPAVSVVTAIEWFFSREESGVILEDDLRLSEDSVVFFSEGLDAFVNQKSVGIISGSNFWGETGTQDSLPVSTYPLTWGWATWRDRWELLRRPFFCSHTFDLTSLTILERCFWKTGIEKCMDRKLDAWDIPFAANFKSLNLKAVIPYRNLVSNVGFDDYAGNTFENVWPLNTPITGSFCKGSKLAVSETIDLTDRVRNDIYQITSKSALVRPFRSIQHLFRFRKWGHLQRAINKVHIPEPELFDDSPLVQ